MTRILNSVSPYSAHSDAFSPSRVQPPFLPCVVKSHKLTTLKGVLSTASPLKPQAYDYLYTKVKKDILVASITGGTDIISCFALAVPTLPVYRGEIQGRSLGMAVEAWDDYGE